MSLAFFASLWHGIKILNYVAIMNQFAYLMETLPFLYCHLSEDWDVGQGGGLLCSLWGTLQQFILNCCSVKVWVWGGYRGMASALSHGWLCLLVLHQIPCAIILISPSLVHVKLLHHGSIFKRLQKTESPWPKAINWIRGTNVLLGRRYGIS